MNETKQKGLITEIQCQLAFSKLGILLSKPIVEDSRYDYLADLGNKFLRIQCKTSSIAEDQSYIEFATRTTRSNTKENSSRLYSKEQIDYFYTYYNNESYLVPVEECSAGKKLRFVIPKNGRIEGVSFAQDYLLKTILEKRENFKDFQEHQINVIANVSSTYSLNKTCPKCGKLISNKATLCLQCENLKKRTVERPTREELKEKIRALPFTTIGNQYGVTDNSIRKWCDAYNLPRKKKDIESYSDQQWKGI